MGALVALAALAPSSARADETHYQSVFMGDRAFGMGGAATGLAADTASVFYNPGALAELPNRSFSASLGLTAFERTRVRNGVRGPAAVEDLRQSGSRAVPVFSAALLRFGPRGPNGLRRHAMALSTVYPASSELDLRVTLSDEGTGIPSALALKRTYRVTLYGLSYAYNISPRLAFGVTAYLAVERFAHEEAIVVADGGMSDGMGGFTGVSSFSALSFLRGRSFDIVPRFGVFYRPRDKVSLGLTLQVPGIPVFSEGRLEQEALLNVYDGTTGQTRTTTTQVSRRGLRFRHPVPWMLRVGVGYYVTDSVTLAADVMVHGWIRSAQRVRGPIGASLENLPFFAADIKRRATFDASMGIEWVAHDGVTLRAGAFTNRSAAPKIPESTNAYRTERVDHYGGTFGIGMHVREYHLTFGVAGSRGVGNALTVDADRLDPDFYARTRIEERVIYLFLTGATRSAARLARRALRRVRGEDERRRPRSRPRERRSERRESESRGRDGGDRETPSEPAAESDPAPEPSEASEAPSPPENPTQSTDAEAATP